MPTSWSPRIYTCINCQGVVTDTDRPCTTCFLTICSACYTTHQHNGLYCPSCGYNTINNALANYCAFHGQYYCQSLHWAEHTDCYVTDDEDEDEDFDMPMNDRPLVNGWGRVADESLLNDPYAFHPLALGKRAAAIEVEAEYLGNGSEPALTLPMACGVDNDGSLRNGVEITTPPAKGDMLVAYVTDTMKALRDGGYGVMPSCGMHTHIDLRDKTDDKRFLSHLFNAFFAVEPILYAMQSNARHNSTYSVPLRNQYKFFEMYGQSTGDFDYKFYKTDKTYAGMSAMNSEKRRKYAHPRYAAFNFHSVYYRGSLEVRLHEGCVDEKVALGWIDLLQSIIARVEKGHSYSAMRKLAEGPVTLKKVRAFGRYFGLTPTQLVFVKERIQRGRGWNFELPRPIVWGVPKRGRPTRDPVMHQMLYMNQRVRCRDCRHEFMLREGNLYCPNYNCDRMLVDRYGNRNYTRVVSRPRRSRIYASESESFNLTPLPDSITWYRDAVRDAVAATATPAVRVPLVGAEWDFTPLLEVEE